MFRPLGRYPVQVLAEVPSAAHTSARFEGEIVSFFGPEILLALAFGPTAGASAAPQIDEDGRFPRLETGAVHQSADVAVLVVARHLDHVVDDHRLLGGQATGRHAAVTHRRRCHSD